MGWAWIAVALADCPPPPPEASVVVQVHTKGVDADGRLTSSRKAIEQGPISVDLDQDGVNDLAVPVPTPDVCPSLWTYALWKTQAACAEPIGHVVGHPRSVSATEVVTSTIEILPTGPSNRPPIGHGAHPPERRETLRTYRFDGVRFTLHSTEVKSGTCHHCALRTCRIED